MVRPGHPLVRLAALLRRCAGGIKLLVRKNPLVRPDAVHLSATGATHERRRTKSSAVWAASRQPWSDRQRISAARDLSGSDPRAAAARERRMHERAGSGLRRQGRSPPPRDGRALLQACIRRPKYAKQRRDDRSRATYTAVHRRARRDQVRRSRRRRVRGDRRTSSARPAARPVFRSQNVGPDAA